MNSVLISAAQDALTITVGGRATHCQCCHAPLLRERPGMTEEHAAYCWVPRMRAALYLVELASRE